MAKMLRRASTKYEGYGHCDHCARGKMLHLKPGPRDREAQVAPRSRVCMTRQRAYFHARSCAFVLWLLVQPTVERVLIDARAVAASRRK